MCLLPLQHRLQTSPGNESWLRTQTVTSTRRRAQETLVVIHSYVPGRAVAHIPGRVNAASEPWCY